MVLRLSRRVLSLGAADSGNRRRDVRIRYLNRSCLLTRRLNLNQTFSLVAPFGVSLLNLVLGIQALIPLPTTVTKRVVPLPIPLLPNPTTKPVVPLIDLLPLSTAGPGIPLVNLLPLSPVGCGIPLVNLLRLSAVGCGVPLDRTGPRADDPARRVAR